MKNFEKPQMEIVEFEAEDIVTTSGKFDPESSTGSCVPDCSPIQEGDAGGAM